MAGHGYTSRSLCLNCADFSPQDSPVGEEHARPRLPGKCKRMKIIARRFEGLSAAWAGTQPIWISVTSGTLIAKTRSQAHGQAIDGLNAECCAMPFRSKFLQCVHPIHAVEMSIMRESSRTPGGC